MELTLIYSYAIGLTLDTPIDFAFSPRLTVFVYYSKTDKIVVCKTSQTNPNSTANHSWFYRPKLTQLSTSVTFWQQTSGYNSPHNHDNATDCIIRPTPLIVI